MQENGVFDEHGNINAKLTINQDNINTWLGGEELDAVKDHVLVILQQAHNSKNFEELMDLMPTFIDNIDNDNRASMYLLYLFITDREGYARMIKTYVENLRVRLLNKHI